MQAEQFDNNVQYMDCHTHLLDYPTIQNARQLIDHAINNNVSKIVVNTVTTTQFPAMFKLEDKYPHFIIPAFGVHPCFISQQEQIESKKNKVMVQNQQPKLTWIQQLTQVLKRQQKYSVGEIGLDFRKDVLQINPKDLQMKYFKQQLELAISMNKSATIHCVRAHGQMLKIFKELNKTIKQQAKPHFIMHSYGGSLDITKSMLKLTNIQIFFSLCLKRSAELCLVIPIEHLICETDSPCQNNIQLLQEENRLQYNTYYHKFKSSLENSNEDNKDKNIDKMQTNQPVNVIANIKSLVKYYKMDEVKFSKILYENSLRAFKLLK